MSKKIDRLENFLKKFSEESESFNHLTGYLLARFDNKTKIEEALWIIQNKIKDIRNCESIDELNMHIKVKKILKDGNKDLRRY